ncbi:hypothetical protein [Holospora undulata]|uniref:Uncharacterized protein n=1 Tax=Holospora undulata HU1 TaxID=1321371 RepID=A0A061JIC1_9PROT|nr:hypothetical protein [Holospora undulata]ETZ05387.1 hypothetical protein K737_300177 [Holospora undulata HU1]
MNSFKNLLLLFGFFLINTQEGFSGKENVGSVLRDFEDFKEDWRTYFIKPEHVQDYRNSDLDKLYKTLEKVSDIVNTYRIPDSEKLSLIKEAFIVLSEKYNISQEDFFELVVEEKKKICSKIREKKNENIRREAGSIYNPEELKEIRERCESFVEQALSPSNLQEN